MPSSATCKYCKSNPCLKGTPVTLENFVDGAYCKGAVSRRPWSYVVYGYIYIGGYGKYWGKQFQGKWFKYEPDGREFTQAFTENMKSISYYC